MGDYNRSGWSLAEFPLPSWRSSSTEHGHRRRMEVWTTIRFEWLHYVVTYRISILLATTELHHLHWHLLLCSTDPQSGHCKNSTLGEIKLHNTQLNLGLNSAPEALWPLTCTSESLCIRFFVHLPFKALWLLAVFPVSNTEAKWGCVGTHAHTRKCAAMVQWNNCHCNICIYLRTL
jgi:hypothetical protein